MFRRALIIRGPLMLTGPLIFIGPLPVGRASDSQRGPVFLAGPDGQRGPDCPDVLFCRFHNRFHDLCEGFGCLRLSLGPRVPKTPGRHTPSPPPPPLATSLARKAVI